LNNPDGTESSENRLDYQSNEQAELKGLGGWLVLVGLGLILSPFIQIKFLYDVFWIPIHDGQWSDAINPASPNYVPNFKAVAISEAAINALLIALGVWLIYLFFRKRRLFPATYICWLLACILVTVIDAIVATHVLSMEQIFDLETTKSLVKMVIHAAIWVPYMLLSRRVKNTFTAS
jgi:magnesium-transporting ATPase (P-type)